ncbi:GNAT family N-acetyltransferase [Rosenbergiella nectarea]|uniref:GNAT family N-acetyltransferase n=1 Tax=Rosenbergiella nectarea TaxID=988801 RepID=UPI001BD9F459|nr:GNAT family N-acetyltransferase [Rosenbergiella nectarea]MBT0729274.1 GNAT family N-acetyltransferase [Rosenbergiella nectarea subsp. apis]
MITIETSDLHSTDSLNLIERLSLELKTLTGDSGKSHFNVNSMDESGCLWILAKDENRRAIGCGAIRPLTVNIAELKRMFSDRSIPGIGSALLAYLETRAKEMGYSQIWLETRHINLRAVNFYIKNGYIPIDNYGPYIGRDDAACFAKCL